MFISALIHLPDFGRIDMACGVAGGQAEHKMVERAETHQ